MPPLQRELRPDRNADLMNVFAYLRMINNRSRDDGDDDDRDERSRSQPSLNPISKGRHRQRHEFIRIVDKQHARGSPPSPRPACGVSPAVERTVWYLLDDGREHRLPPSQRNSRSPPDRANRTP